VAIQSSKVCCGRYGRQTFYKKNNLCRKQSKSQKENHYFTRFDYKSYFQIGYNEIGAGPLSNGDDLVSYNFL